MIKTPTNQKLLTNVAVVRIKKCGKRFVYIKNVSSSTFHKETQSFHPSFREFNSVEAETSF